VCACVCVCVSPLPIYPQPLFLDNEHAKWPLIGALAVRDDYYFVINFVILKYRRYYF